MQALEILGLQYVSLWQRRLQTPLFAIDRSLREIGH
jgi:hypothetical protein